MKPKFKLSLLVVCLLAGGAYASGGESSGDGGDLTGRMMSLVIQLSVIIFAAKIGGLIFERIKLPAVLGELAAGMLIGPYLLGKIPLIGFSQGLFAATHGFPSPELYGLCSIAAIVLLFITGLETDLRLFLRYSLAGGMVGIGGAVASFVMGDLILVFLSGPLLGESFGPFHPACLMLGTITTATSVGVIARILSQKRKLDSPEGVTVLSAAVIDDVIGIVLLAVVMGFVSARKVTGGVDWGHIGIIAAKAVGVWLVATAVALIASRKISFLLKTFGSRTSIAVMALAMALGLSGLFEEAGLAMIIGAYTMGLSLSNTDISHVVREKLNVIHALLVPIFFCVIGMRIDFGAIGSPAVIWFGVIYAAVAMMSKILGCGIPAMFANFTPVGALRIGFGMIPRCEVALIIAGVALAGGILTQEIFAAVIIMVILNTMIAPPALVLLFGSTKPSMRKEISTRQKTQRVISYEFPSIELAEFLGGKLLSQFEAEGFFVHRLTRDSMLHQLRKDDAIIDLDFSGTTISFDCDRGQVPLVHTAMYEALAELEQTMKGLRKTVDARGIGSAIQDQAEAQGRSFNLENYLSLETLEPDLKANSKQEVIDKLLDMLARTGRVKDIAHARQAVISREQSISTGLQYGLAIPHGRTDAVDEILCAVGVNRDGVDFDSLDGKPSKIFIMTLSPANKPCPHIQFMATISQVLNNQGRQAILASRTPRKLRDALMGKFVAAKTAPATTITKAAKITKSAGLSIGDYIKPQLVRKNLSATTKDQVLDELLQMLDAAGLIDDMPQARRAVADRENQMPTILEHGVCIPHGRTDAVKNLVCAVGLQEQGIDFGAPDNSLSTIFILTLVPQDQSEPYVQFMAMLMGVLDEQGLQKILAAQTDSNLYAALTS